VLGEVEHRYWRCFQYPGFRLRCMTATISTVSPLSR
jgi:hypothetical protein